MRLSVFKVSSQREALVQLAQLAERSTVHPLVRETAIRIVSECQSRDDECELEAIFNAVKTGSSHVKALANGVKYVADGRWADHFTAPYRLLKQCANGACAEDCDGQASLIVALAGSLGFLVGLRAWGRSEDNYVHVYAVAGLPKRNPAKVVGLDSTVDESYVGWEPPKGVVMTAWLE